MLKVLHGTKDGNKKVCILNHSYQHFGASSQLKRTGGLGLRLARHVAVVIDLSRLWGRANARLGVILAERRSISVPIIVHQWDRAFAVSGSNWAARRGREAFVSSCVITHERVHVRIVAVLRRVVLKGARSAAGVHVARMLAQAVLCICVDVLVGLG